MTEISRTNNQDIWLKGQLKDVLDEMQTVQKSLETFQSDMNRRLKTFRKVTDDYFKDSTDRLGFIGHFFDLSLDKPEKRVEKQTHTFKAGMDAIGIRLESLSKHLDSHYLTINQRLNNLDQRVLALNKDVGSMKQRFDAMDDRLMTIDSRFSDIEERLEDLETPSDAIDKRFSTLDPRLEAIEQTLEDIDPRFTDLEKKFVELEPKLDELGQRLDSRFDILKQPLVDIRQCFDPLVQHVNNVSLQIGASTQSVEKTLHQGFSASDQCSATINGIAMGIVKEVQGLRTETRAGHFNAGARAFNASSTRPDSKICAPIGHDGSHIPSFPTNYKRLQRLQEVDLDKLLKRLELPISGTKVEKRDCLCTYLGLPRMSAPRWLRT